MESTMYHYTESGLQNIWLANGYTKRQTERGESVAIHDADQLHEAIGRTLAARPHLTLPARRAWPVTKATRRDGGRL